VHRRGLVLLGEVGVRQVLHDPLIPAVV
jgi:hypothetical protein